MVAEIGTTSFNVPPDNLASVSPPVLNVSGTEPDSPPCHTKKPE